MTTNPAPAQPSLSTLAKPFAYDKPRKRRTMHGADLLGELDLRIEQLRIEAIARGRTLLPPLLALGVSERVGSNWFADTLRKACPLHNEPFRQQIAADHPLSTLNPHPHTDLRTVAEALGPLGTQWLATFVTSKYATCRHVVKETNLFFATPWLLRLFSDAPAVVLSRSPLGITSSFRRSGLFRRWRYRDRYDQMASMTRHKPWRQWSPLVADDDPADLLALVRLIVLNTLLLADSLTGRDLTHVAYEAAVSDHHATLTALRRALPDLDPQSATAPAPTGMPTVDDTYATTTSKTRLTAALSRDEAALVLDETHRCLTAACDLVPAQAVSRARTWLSGDHHYALTPPSVPTTSPRRAPRQAGTVPVRYVPACGLRWRNLLVTNREFCQFLNALRGAGLDNTICGTHLLLTEMPHTRGGRIHRDPTTDRYRVADGYHDHPVYWVTWIGAAAFAAHAAAHLPDRQQARALTTAAAPAGANTDYHVGDTTAAIEPHLSTSDIHHRVGNLQIWCADGPPAQTDQAGLIRYLHGAAWNTPSTPDEIDRTRSRHLLGSSRGVGIRLARPIHTDPVAAPVEELAERLTAWIDTLSNRQRSLVELDQLVVNLLTRSQADVGLGAHIAASTGEALHG